MALRCTPIGLHVPEWAKFGDAVLSVQGLSLQKSAWEVVQAVPVTEDRVD